MADHSDPTQASPVIVADDEINLLDYWRVLMKRKTLLILIILAAAIGSVVVSLYLPKIYASTTSLLPPQEGAAGSGLIASQIPGGLGGVASGVLGIKSPVDLWLGILKSETIRDAIVSQFNLKEVYEVETDQDAGTQLGEALSIKKTKEEIISITIEDRDPHRAAEIAKAIVHELDKFNKNIVMTAGGRMRTFVEQRLDEAKIALTRAEETLKVFQEKNGAVQLDAQSSAIIGAIGEIKGKVMAKEVELQTLLSFATSQNPQVEILKTEIKELKRGLNELEEGKAIPEQTTGSIFIPTARLPDLALQYARLLREEKIQQNLFGLLSEQYEMARIQEAKDTPTVQVLDAAKVPEKRIKPKRTLIVLLSTFTAGFFGVFLVFFLEYIEKASVHAP